MDTTPRRTSGRVATLVVALLLLAVPASAAIITQNFLQAEITADAACFVKVAGGDTTIANSPAVVTLTDVNTSSNGIILLQETVAISGYDGDRVTYTDVVQYRNDCAYDIEVELVAEAGMDGVGPIGGDWTGIYAEIYLSNDVNYLLGSTDLSDGNWDGPIVVDEGVLGTASAGGTTTLSTGEFLTTAFMVEVAEGQDATGNTGTLRYTATATAQ